MNRVAVFAHYDKSNIIQEYVIYYLTELKKVCDKIIFVSDGNICEQELLKIKDIVIHSIAQKHGEYDFGSYKRGYIYAKEMDLLNNCDEFILANDSCYGPLYEFQVMFDNMQNETIDYWGVTGNPVGVYGEANPHIQSYFVVFKPCVFNSDIFDSFMKLVKKEVDKRSIIINYEIGLSKLLFENGFRHDVYCKSSKTLVHSHIFSAFELLKNDNNILVKTSIFRYNNLPARIKPSLKWLKASNYNIRLIKSDLKYNLDKKGKSRHRKDRFKMYRRKIIRFSFKERTLLLLGKEFQF